MARTRNHAAEYAAAKARAKALGFESQRQRKTAVRTGKAVSAKEKRTNPAAVRREREQVAARKAGFPTYGTYLAARKEAKKWSDKHSRQNITRYNPRMSPEQFRDYYAAFVKDWGSPRDRAALNHYLELYPGEWEPPDHDWPY